jgi:hypothetical protein
MEERRRRQEGRGDGPDRNPLGAAQILGGALPRRVERAMGVRVGRGYLAGRARGDRADAGAIWTAGSPVSRVIRHTRLARISESSLRAPRAGALCGLGPWR